KPSRGEVGWGLGQVKMEGLTGTSEVEEKGDNKKAKYFVMRVASTGNWADKRLIRVIEMAAPGAK
ncbi:branched chain amino acid ABC transporter substrate-binding protein, partial [Thermus scotoductus]